MLTKRAIAASCGHRVMPAVVFLLVAVAHISGVSSAPVSETQLKMMFANAFVNPSTFEAASQPARTRQRRFLADTSSNICSGVIDDAGSQASPTCLCDGAVRYPYPCCYDQGDNTVCTERFAAGSAECGVKEDFYESCFDIGVSDYVVTSPGCVLGSDISGESYSGLTADECAQKCDEYGFECVAFTYGVDHGVDDDYLPGDCLLKSDTDSESCPSHNLDLYVKEGGSGYAQCYTPGYVISDANCEGTGEDCSLAAECDTANYYTGDAELSCPIVGSAFKLDGCGRGGEILNEGTSSALYYIVLPFYTCNLTEVFISASNPAGCAAFADTQGWNAFSIGNGACSEDTGTACAGTDVRCFMYDNCTEHIVPSADSDLYILSEDIGTEYDYDDVGHAFDCLAEVEDKCCSRPEDLNKTNDVVAQFTAFTGAAGFASGFDNWIACGGDSGGDGCSRIQCAFWCLMVSDCNAYFYEQHDFDLDGIDDFGICSFSSNCTLSHPYINRPGCKGHFLERSDNCLEYSTRDCSDCVTCSPGYVNSEGQCQLACDDGLYADGSDICQKCQPYCDACTDASTCTTCQITPKKYYLSGGDCVIPCTLPSDLGTNVEPDDSGANSFGCEAGEVLVESGACDIKCEDGYYVDNAGTTEYSCNPSGSTLTSATATCAACSGVLPNCLTCSAFDTCLTCESGYEVSGGSCVDSDDCATTPCQNGGTCTDTGTNSLSCDCPSGFGGSFCEEDSDDCASDPCSSTIFGGAQCVDTGLFEYNCTCLNGWTGLLCQNPPECSGFSSAGSGDLPDSCVCDAYAERYEYPCCSNQTSWLQGDSSICGNDFAANSTECLARADAVSTCSESLLPASSTTSLCRNEGCDVADKAGGQWHANSTFWLRERTSEFTDFEVRSFVTFNLSSGPTVYDAGEATFTAHVFNKLSADSCGDVYLARVTSTEEDLSWSSEVDDDNVVLLGTTCEGDSSDIGYPGTILEPDYGAPVSISMSADVTQLVQDALYFNSKVLILRVYAENANIGAAFNDTGSAAPALTISGDSLDALRNCFTPGITLNDPTCTGSVHDCEETVECSAADGYGGIAQLQCSANDGLFRASQCFRERFASDDTNASTVYYPVSSMECTAGVVEEITGASLPQCASACDVYGVGTCGGFNMGNGACDEAGTCRDTSTCTLVEPGACVDSLRPVASDDFYWKLLDINASFTDETLFGSHFDCWSEPVVDFCCVPDFSGTVSAQYSDTAGPTGGLLNLFIGCGAFADPGLDGCSLFECFEYCRGTPGCEGFAFGAQDDDLDGIADYYTCGFVSDSGCAVSSVPDCNFYTLDGLPDNCTTTATFDCTVCAECDPGFFLDESLDCVQACPTGTFANASSGACDRCSITACQSCSDGVTCDACLMGWELVGGECAKLQCNVSTLALNDGQITLVVPPGATSAELGYVGQVNFLDTIKVLCADGYTNGTNVTSIGVVVTEGVTPDLPMKNREATPIMCSNDTSFYPGFDLNDLVCIDADDCESDPCLNGGTCVDGGFQSFTCLCATGFTGTLCNVDVDDCVSEPCVNGTCTDTGTNDFECDCAAGFAGPLCAVDINDCTSNPCGDHGTCVDLPSSAFECVCEDGYIGTLCDDDVDDCASGPCQNGGICSDLGASAFSCNCQQSVTGYTGTTCTDDADDCSPDPCRNGGTCTDQGTQLWECSCPLGYVGTRCKTDIDDCLSQPCGDHGSCTDSGLLSYSCVCDSGYSGVTCTVDVDDCASTPCSGSATCTDTGADSFQCTCPSGFGGTLCDTDADDCGTGGLGETACGDHGVCVDEGTLAYSCSCNDGYEGSTCTDETDDCASSPCDASATCEDHGHLSFYCSCPDGYEGTTCSDEIDDCASDPCSGENYTVGHWQCFDSGINSFVCECDDGWGGESCDQLPTCSLGFGNANSANCICSGLNNLDIVKLGGIQASGYLYEFPCCNNAPTDRDLCEDPQLGNLACNARETKRDNCLSNDALEGMTECYSPGYLIDGAVTGAGTSCAGTVGACESLVQCHESAGYSGLASLSCPTDGGYFRLRGCSRDRAISNTDILYLVAPFQECDDSDSYLLSTLTTVTVQDCADACAADSDCVGFEMGSGHSNYDECRLLSSCSGRLVPSFDHDYFWDAIHDTEVSDTYVPPFALFNTANYEFDEHERRCCPAQNDLTASFVETDFSQPLFTGPLYVPSSADGDVQYGKNEWILCNFNDTALPHTGGCTTPWCALICVEDATGTCAAFEIATVRSYQELEFTARGDASIDISHANTRAERAGGSGRAGIATTASISAYGEGRMSVTYLSGDIYIGIARDSFDITTVPDENVYAYYTCGILKVEGEPSVSGGDCGSTSVASSGDVVDITIEDKTLTISLGDDVIHVDDSIDMSDSWTFVVGQRVAAGTTWEVFLLNETGFATFHHDVCSFSSSCSEDVLALYDDIDHNGLCSAYLVSEEAPSVLCNQSAASDRSFCVECLPGYFNFQGICVEECPVGTFPNMENVSATDGTWQATNSCIPCLDGCMACADKSSCEHCVEPLVLRRLVDGSGEPISVAGRQYECADVCDADEVTYDADGDTVDDSCLRCTSIDVNCASCSPSDVPDIDATCDVCDAGFFRRSSNDVPGVYDECVNCTEACTDERGSFYFAEDGACASGTDTEAQCANCTSIDSNCAACDESGANCSYCHEGFYRAQATYIDFAAQAGLFCEDTPEYCPIESLASCLEATDFLGTQDTYSSTTTISSSTNIYGCYVQSNVLTFNSDGTSTADTKGVQALICGLCENYTMKYDLCRECRYECPEGSYYSGDVCDGTGFSDPSCLQCNETIQNCQDCDSRSECKVCQPGYFRLDSCGDGVYDSCEACRESDCGDGTVLASDACTNGTDTALPCVSCEDANCVACTSGSICTSCAPNYELADDGITCVYAFEEKGSVIDITSDEFPDTFSGNGLGSTYLSAADVLSGIGRWAYAGEAEQAGINASNASLAATMVNSLTATRELIGSYLPRYGAVGWQSGIGCLRVSDSSGARLEYSFYACLSVHANVLFTSNDGGKNGLSSLQVVNHTSTDQQIDELFLTIVPAGETVASMGHDYDAEALLLLDDDFQSTYSFVVLETYDGYDVLLDDPVWLNLCLIDSSDSQVFFKPFFKEEFDVIPSENEFPGSQQSSYTQLFVTDNNPSVEAGVWCAPLLVPGPGLLIVGVRPRQRPYPATTHSLAQSMPLKQSILFTMPLSDNEANASLAVVAPRMRNDGFSAFSPLSRSSELLDQISVISGLPAVRPLGQNVSFLNGANEKDYCDDVQTNVVLRAQILQEVENAMGQIGNTAAWTVNLDGVSADLDNEFVAQYLQVLSEAVADSDPYLFPIFIEETAFSTVPVLTSSLLASCSNLTTTCLAITGVIDGPLPGGTPKAIEMYAACDVADLSTYGIGIANDGGGTDGEEIALSGSASEGQFLYIASESVKFQEWFNFAPDVVNAGLSDIDGNDAIELYHNSVLVDLFGGPLSTSPNAPWLFSNGWAYRRNETKPCASDSGCGWGFQQLQDNFVVKQNVFDENDPAANNSVSVHEFPVGRFRPGGWDPCTCNDLPCEVQHETTSFDAGLYEFFSTILSERQDESTFDITDVHRMWPAFYLDLQEQAISLAQEDATITPRDDVNSVGTHAITCNATNGGSEELETALAIHDAMLSLISDARGHYLFGHTVQECMNSADPWALGIFRAKYKGFAQVSALVNGPPDSSDLFSLSLSRAILDGTRLPTSALSCTSNATMQSYTVRGVQFPSVSCAAWYYQGLYYAVVLNSVNSSTAPTDVSFAFHTGSVNGGLPQPQTLHLTSIFGPSKGEVLTMSKDDDSGDPIAVELMLNGLEARAFITAPLCMHPELITSPGDNVIRVFGAGSEGANGLYQLTGANSTTIAYLKQPSTNKDGIDLEYSPQRFAIYMDVSSLDTPFSWKLVDVEERTNGRNDIRTIHGATLYTGTASANGSLAGKIEGIEWSIADGDAGVYPPPIAGCALNGDWSPLLFQFDRDDVLPNGFSSGTEWRNNLYEMEVLRNAGNIDASGIGSLTFADDNVAAAPTVSMHVGGPTGLTDTGLVQLNISLSGTDSCLRQSIAMESSNSDSNSALPTIEVSISDCAGGGTVCLNTFDIFGSDETMYDQSCSAIVSGDFGATTLVEVLWNSSALASLTVPSLGIELTSSLPSDWFAWQRITHVKLTAGDTVSAADTTVVLTGLSVQNSDLYAINCTGQWSLLQDGACLLTSVDNYGTVGDSDLEVSCSSDSIYGDGQIVERFAVSTFLTGANGGDSTCQGKVYLKHGDLEVVSNCTAATACDNTFCDSITTAEVVDETPTNHSWFEGDPDRSVFMTGRQIFDGDEYHDWTVPRLNEQGILDDGGAFVIITPNDPELRSRVIVDQYGVRGSFRTNTTATDPFSWTLHAYVGDEFDAFSWRDIQPEDWILIDDRNSELLGAEAGSISYFETMGNWTALTNGTIGARLFKFAVQQTRNSDDAGTRAGQFAMSELELQRCVNTDAYANEYGREMALL